MPSGTLRASITGALAMLLVVCSGPAACGVWTAHGAPL